MAQLRKRHIGLNGSTLPEDTVALSKRYRHGNESDKYMCMCMLVGIGARSQDWTACRGVPSQLSMTESHHLLMSTLIHECDGRYLLPMLPLGQNPTATALHSMAAPKHPVSDDGIMDTTVRWVMASALTTLAPVMTLVHVAWSTGSAYTKWLYHPLVYVFNVLLRVKARRDPWWHATI